MRILLTGHKGFLGSEIYEAFTKENAIEIYGLDCGLSWENWQEMFREFRRRGGKFDLVIHCGAVSDTEQTGNLLWQLNYQASCEIADYCERTNTKLLFISSGTAIKPDTAYAWSKHCAEFYMRQKVAGMTLCILRPYNIWSFDESEKSNPSIVYKILIGQLEQVYRNCHRDFIHISDVVSAVMRVVHDWMPGVFSLGTAQPTIVSELVEAISEQCIPVFECPINPCLVAKTEALLPNWDPTPITERLVYLKEQCSISKATS